MILNIGCPKVTFPFWVFRDTQLMVVKLRQMDNLFVFYDDLTLKEPSKCDEIVIMLRYK